MVYDKKSKYFITTIIAITLDFVLQNFVSQYRKVGGN